MLMGVALPPTLYVNDPSLLIWNVDYDGITSDQQSIMYSPMVGGGEKSFLRSEINFFPL